MSRDLKSGSRVELGDVDLVHKTSPPSAQAHPPKGENKDDTKGRRTRLYKSVAVHPGVGLPPQDVRCQLEVCSTGCGICARFCLSPDGVGRCTSLGGLLLARLASM